MKAMIFAAGLGTRLKPITDSMPKALVKVGNKPVLQHVIEHVKSVGIRSEAVNDNDVTAIYYREIPNVIFKSPDEKEYEKKTGYTYVNL